MLAVTLLSGLLAWAPAASAHPSLLQSNPPPGVVAKRAPDQLTLSFNESMEPSGSRVTIKQLDGKPVKTGELVVGERNASLKVPLRDNLKGAVYDVTWSVLGTDGHRVGGEFRFGVAGEGGAAPDGIEQLGPAAGAGSPAGGTASSTDGPVPVAVRWASLLVAAVLLGGWLLGRRARAAGIALPDERIARMRTWAWVIALALAFEAAVAVADSGAGPGLDAALLTETTSGVLTLVRIAAWAVLGAAALRLRRPGLLGPAAAIALATHALDGHTAAVADDRGLAWLVSLAHVEGAAVWTGGLIALVAWSRFGASLWPLMRAFMPIAGVAMVVLAIAGVLTAVREVDSWMFLRWSGYGRVVIVKSLLLLGVLGLAGWATWHRRRTRGDDTLAGAAGDASPTSAAPSPARAVVLGLRVEAAAAMVVLALAATLAGLVQGRGQPSYAQRGSLLTGAALASTATPSGPVQITLAPGRPGTNTLSAIPQALREGDLPEGARSIVVRLECDCARDGERVALRETAPGIWSATVELAAEGTWFAYVGVDDKEATAPISLAVDDPHEGGPEPLLVRAPADLSGTGARHCRSFVQGLAIGVGRLNASGGVDGGRKVALDVRDDGGEARRAAALARADDPDVIAPCGEAGAAAIRASEDALVLAGDATTPVADSPSADVFRIAPDPHAEGVGLGRFLLQAGLRNAFGAAKRIAVVVADRGGEKRLAGLRSALDGRGVTIERFPADAAESAASLRRITNPREYLAAVLDGDRMEVAAALREFGGADGRVVTSQVFVSPELASEPFMLASGALGRLGVLRLLSEITPDSQDGLGYVNGMLGLHSAERPRLAGVRGYVTGLTLGEATRDGADRDEMAERLRRPGRYTDALAMPWRADAPAQGSQAFTIYRASFLPSNLVPSRISGMDYSGRFFQRGAWSRIAPYVYGPATPVPETGQAVAR